MPAGSRVSMHLLESLNNSEGNSNGDVKKATVWISKTTTLHAHDHAFVYIFFAVLSLHYYNVKLSNVTNYRGRKHLAV